MKKKNPPRNKLIMKVGNPKVKDLKFPTCNKQDSLT